MICHNLYFHIPRIFGLDQKSRQCDARRYICHTHHSERNGNACLIVDAMVGIVFFHNCLLDGFEITPFLCLLFIRCDLTHSITAFQYGRFAFRRLLPKMMHPLFDKQGMCLSIAVHSTLGVRYTNGVYLRLELIDPRTDNFVSGISGCGI